MELATYNDFNCNVFHTELHHLKLDINNMEEMIEEFDPLFQ